MTDPASHRVDLDLRLISYFVAVAEHRHFGQAAAALRVAHFHPEKCQLNLERTSGEDVFARPVNTPSPS
ncbi:hypothetical protein [Mycobacterium sp.]|uniref:hypothetical protein n=1 Tax=Mycobacterium sp. TaxID=1785 RepID=UPI0039C9AB7D